LQLQSGSPESLRKLGPLSRGALVDSIAARAARPLHQESYVPPDSVGADRNLAAVSIRSPPLAG
jgi:hypothetical protein